MAHGMLEAQVRTIFTGIAMGAGCRTNRMTFAQERAAVQIAFPMAAIHSPTCLLETFT
jgi:hypothetical protein